VHSFIGRSSWRQGGRYFPFCLLACLLALTGCPPKQEPGKAEGPPVKVEAIPVRVMPLEQTLTAVGSLSSPQDTPIAPQVSGKVVALKVEQGHVVEKGAVVARLDDGVQRAAVMSAEAAVANARQVYERDRTVVETGAVSEQQLLSDQAALREAEAQLEQARTNLAYTVIRAPFTGVLGIRQISLGSYLTAGSTIVNIHEFDPLHLDFDIPQQDVLHLRSGADVRFQVIGLEGEFKGVVTTVNQALAASSRTVQVQATVGNPDHRLKPGMFAFVTLIVGEMPEALFVPMQAIVGQAQMRHIWVVGPGDRAESRTVQVGVYRDNWVQVVSGLVAADRVVTAGVQKLRPGSKLVITPYQPIHNPRLDLSSPSRQGRP
jgi:membrane fusion protein (multidrug efflux system)